ncbi:MAG: hypothetical protein JSW54_06560 [Fidelibacterota bacterium]|nr:MAG: hypothetical protein JSW54_06560 [Candidatus Neomarinimicrobiota bacterium]
MAKGQTSFAEKAKKAAERKADTRPVRIIKSTKATDTGAVRFSDRMVAVPSDANLDEYLKKMVEEE